jgi:ATP-dependent RNA helicase RhlE
MIGCAQTGTGKTAAFALPILQLLGQRSRRRTRGSPRALVLTPTRELAIQVDENFQHYGTFTDLRHAVIYGGVGQHPQVRALRQGVDIVVATPGRLLDLFQQGHMHFDEIEIFVLDEADRMLDMGFAPDVKRVLAELPSPRQSLLFSATMPEPIRRLAESFLQSPERIEVAPVSSTAEKVTQSIRHVEKENKPRLLVHTLREHGMERTLVFTRTKYGADKLVKRLGKNGIDAAAIHGNKSQGARQRALEGFRNGHTGVLVATDIAARGIDVRGIDMVVNFELPNEPESYVHRIGRTARAGAEGMAISFCDATEREYLHSIEKLIRKEIPVEDTHPFHVTVPAHRPRSRSEPNRPVGHGKKPRSKRRGPSRNRNGSTSSGSGSNGGAASGGSEVAGGRRRRSFRSRSSWGAS